MKLVFLRKEYLNDETMKRLGFKKSYHYNSFIFSEKDFCENKIKSKNVKIGVSYRYRSLDDSDITARMFQSIIIYGDNISYKDSGLVDLSPNCGSVSAVLPKFLEMAKRNLFEIKDI